MDWAVQPSFVPLEVRVSFDANSTTSAPEGPDRLSTTWAPSPLDKVRTGARLIVIRSVAEVRTHAVADVHTDGLFAL